MPQFFSCDFPKDAWDFIETHFFGDKYIAQRCCLTVKELRTVLKESRDPRAIDDILFYAGACIELSIVDELYVTRSSQICSGSYRIIKQRMSIKTLVHLCNDFTDCGDICDGDVYRIIEISGVTLVLIHHSDETHIIEVKRDWVHFDKLQTILLKQTYGLQINGGLSPLSTAVINQFLIDLNGIETAQEYYQLVNNFNRLASHFENSLPRTLSFSYN